MSACWREASRERRRRRRRRRSEFHGCLVPNSLLPFRSAVKRFLMDFWSLSPGLHSFLCHLGMGNHEEVSLFDALQSELGNSVGCHAIRLKGKHRLWVSDKCQRECLLGGPILRDTRDNSKASGVLENHHPRRERASLLVSLSLRTHHLLILLLLTITISKRLPGRI